MGSHLVEGLRNGSGGDWWFMAPSKTWQLPLTSAWLCELCPIRRDEYPHAYVWMSPVNVTFPRKRAGEDIGTPESTNSLCRISFLSDFSFMWLKTQSLLVVGAHPLGLMQTRGFATIHPKVIFSPLGCGMCKPLLSKLPAASANGLLFWVIKLPHFTPSKLLSIKAIFVFRKLLFLIHLFLPCKMSKLNSFHT